MYTRTHIQLYENKYLCIHIYILVYVYVYTYTFIFT